MELALELWSAERSWARLRKSTWKQVYRRMQREQAINETKLDIQKVVAVTTVVTAIGTTAIAAKSHTAIEAEMPRIVSTQHTSLTDVEPQEAAQLPEVELSEVAEVVEMVADKATKAAEVELVDATEAEVEAADATKAEAEAAAKAEAEAAAKAEAEAEAAAKAEAEAVAKAEAEAEAAAKAEAEAVAKAEAEAQVVEAPVVEAQVVEAPVVEAQVVEAPVVEAQVAEAPVVEAQVAEAQQGFSKSSFTKYGMTIPVYDITDDFFFSNGAPTGDLQLTDADYTALCKVVAVEAGGEPLAGKIIVANAVLNRVRLNHTNVIIEVTKNNQFASIANIGDGKITSEIRQAVDMALAKDYTRGVLKAISAEQNNGALWFYSPKYIGEGQLKKRKNIQVAVRYGGHVFYGIWEK